MHADKQSSATEGLDPDLQTNTGQGGIHWYVVHSKPQQERAAQLTLQRLGISTFFPEVKESKVIRRKKQIRISPLFPGYLFARFRVTDQYRAVVYARGVRAVVSFGLTPVIVDEEIIEAIKGKLVSGYVTTPASTFTPGQVVRIQEGPLHGLEAIFEREIPGYERAVLLLRSISYQARVVVDVEQVVNL
jgi:transcriptional antiterminator RfaH